MWFSIRYVALVLAVAGAGAVCSGCSFVSNIGGSLNDAGKQLSSGAVRGLSEQDTALQRLVDSIVTSLGRTGSVQAAHLRDSLLGERTRTMLDAIEQDLGRNLSATTTGLRDTLLGPHTREWLIGLEREIATDLVRAAAGMRDNLLGAETTRRVALLRDELLGRQTGLLLAALRDTLVGPELREQLALIRDELLGQETQSRIDSIAAGLSGRLEEQEGFLKKHITEILWTVGGIIALLLVLGALLKRKQMKQEEMLKLLTYQIHEIPDRAIYDEVTARIQQQAQKESLEPELRKLLESQGILGKEPWESRIAKTGGG